MRDQARLDGDLLRPKKDKRVKEAARQRKPPKSVTKADQQPQNSFSAPMIAHQGSSSVTISSPKNQMKNGSSATAKVRRQSQLQRQQLKIEREAIVLWKHPLTTIQYSCLELAYTVLEWCQKLWARKALLCVMAALLTAGLFLVSVNGPHRSYFEKTEQYLLWCAWWVGLGVLSSVGLGTGLHTFLLYLGPHIAAVTMAAYECGTTNFPSPPYPDSILCPDDEAEAAVTKSVVTMWDIMSKVRVEAFCWGAGTALGELPPYFMARAHRLSGYDPEEDDDEYDELQAKQICHPDQLNWFDRAKIGIEKLVEKVGFVGIMACASIPNPLFDLAGITCGHFLVPFWTFFGATLIGKAVIKMHIQKIFVITAFNERLVQYAVSCISQLPGVGSKLEAPFEELLVKQKEKLHRRTGSEETADPGVLSWIFEKFVMLMIMYFILSIVNSLAQSYHKRLHKARKR